jgi:hypothetical protein
MVESLPKRYEFDHFVYLCCEGNPAGREAVLEMTYVEAFLWISFKKFDSWNIEHPNG